MADRKRPAELKTTPIKEALGKSISRRRYGTTRLSISSSSSEDFLGADDGGSEESMQSPTLPGDTLSPSSPPESFPNDNLSFSDNNASQSLADLMDPDSDSPSSPAKNNTCTIDDDGSAYGIIQTLFGPVCRDCGDERVNKRGLFFCSRHTIARHLSKVHGITTAAPVSIEKDLLTSLISLHARAARQKDAAYQDFLGDGTTNTVGCGEGN